MSKQKNFLKYFLVFIGFVVFYVIVFYFNKRDFELDFLSAADKVPAIRNFGSGTVEKMQKIAGSWGALVGLGLGLLAWVISLLLLGILKLVRLAKFSLANMLALILVYGVYLALAIELVYYEVRYSPIAIAVIFFVGYPLYYTAIGTLILIVLIYLFSFVRKMRGKKNGVEATAPEVKTPPPTSKMAILGLVVAPLVLTGAGCSLIGDVEGLACELLSDPAHCYQDGAVAEGEDDDCEKVKQPAQFKSAGSNPPQDKCYLMIAQNTGDLDACKKIKGGPMSYSKEDCILEVAVSTVNPEGCGLLTGQARAKCIGDLGPKMTPDVVLEVDNQIELLKNELKNSPDEGLAKQLKGLEDKRNGMLDVMNKDNKEQYRIQSDPLNKEIIGDWAVGDFDSETKNKLIGVNEKLKAQGSAMTKEQYNSFKDYYAFINDPKNDIEQMDDRQIVKDRWNEKVGNMTDALKFWKTKDTPKDQALDEQLRFYERMLERQEAINAKLTPLQEDFERNAGMAVNAAKDKILDTVKEKAIEEIFGDLVEDTTGAAGVATAVIGEALDEVQSAAKAAEFRGLVNAYDKGMAEEVGKFKGDVEKAHAAVVKNMSADPYAYAEGNSFAQYGNLIENKDCDGTNPHCLNKDIFWKAMKKSYKYQNQ